MRWLLVFVVLAYLIIGAAFYLAVARQQERAAVERERADQERARADQAREEAQRQAARADQAKEEAKKQVAKAQVQVLEKALQAYKLNNGEYPMALDDLAKPQPSGGGALVEKKALIDPWDNAYQYEPAGKRNDGKKPDVWAVAPDKTLIGNWPEKK
jgi:hypothetical protein